MVFKRRLYTATKNNYESYGTGVIKIRVKWPKRNIELEYLDLNVIK